MGTSVNSSIFAQPAIEKEEAFLREPTAENALFYLGWVQHLGTDYHTPKDDSVGRALDVLVGQFERMKLPPDMPLAELATERRSAYTFYRDVALMFGLEKRAQTYQKKVDS